MFTPGSHKGQNVAFLLSPLTANTMNCTTENKRPTAVALINRAGHLASAVSTSNLRCADWHRLGVGW